MILFFSLCKPFVRIKMVQIFFNFRSCSAAQEIPLEFTPIIINEYFGISLIFSCSKNEIFLEGKNINVLRSGNQKRGEDARFLTKIIRKKSNKKIKLGQGIFLKDCQQ